MIQNNESIYNILPAEKIEYPKGPIYKSRYPGILPPTGSTFGTKNTTVPGVKKIIILHIKQFYSYHILFFYLYFLNFNIKMNIV